MNPYLSVIIPSYNEEENFKRGVLGNIYDYLKSKKFTWEVLLIDDGSTDQTAKLLSNFSQKHSGFNFFEITHGGKLKALEKGIKEANGEIILFSDFDQSTPLSEFDKFIPKFKKGADVVIGSRVERLSKRINDPIFRYIRSRMLNLLIKFFLFGGINDTQCGFKALRLDVAKELFEKLFATKRAKPKGGFMGPWDIELLFLAKKSNYKIVSVPITWQYFKSQRLSVFTEPVRFIIDIFTIRYFNISGKYIREAPNKRQ